MQVRTWMSALAISAGLTTFSMAQVTGKATLDGKAPEMKTIDMSGVKECNDMHPDPVSEETVVADDKGNLKNVVVSIKKEEGQEIAGEAPKGPAVIDQKGCLYTPHVLPMMVGQDLVAKNDDAFLHNVQGNPQQNPPFNLPQPNKDDGKKLITPKAAEHFAIKCQVHPWMVAYVLVFDNPYFATSGDDGSFTLPKGLADGDYTFIAWHEKFGEVEQKATVKDGKAELKFVFKDSGAQATPVDSNVKLASDVHTMSCPMCENRAAKIVEKSDKKDADAQGEGQLKLKWPC